MSCSTSASKPSSEPCATARALKAERTTSLRLHELLAQAQQALATCRVSYSEFNQFEGEWTPSFDEAKVEQALHAIHAELGLPAPVPVRGRA